MCEGGCWGEAFHYHAGGSAHALAMLNSCFYAVEALLNRIYTLSDESIGVGSCCLQLSLHSLQNAVFGNVDCYIAGLLRAICRDVVHLSVEDVVQG